MEESALWYLEGTSATKCVLPSDSREKNEKKNKTFLIRYISLVYQQMKSPIYFLMLYKAWSLGGFDEKEDDEHYEFYKTCVDLQFKYSKKACQYCLIEATFLEKKVFLKIREGPTIHFPC